MHDLLPFCRNTFFSSVLPVLKVLQPEGFLRSYFCCCFIYLHMYKRKHRCKLCTDHYWQSSLYWYFIMDERWYEPFLQNLHPLQETEIKIGKTDVDIFKQISKISKNIYFKDLIIFLCFFWVVNITEIKSVHTYDTRNI